MQGFTTLLHAAAQLTCAWQACTTLPLPPHVVGTGPRSSPPAQTAVGTECSLHCPQAGTHLPLHCRSVIAGRTLLPNCWGSTQLTARPCQRPCCQARKQLRLHRRLCGRGARCTPDTLPQQRWRAPPEQCLAWHPHVHLCPATLAAASWAKMAGRNPGQPSLYICACKGHWQSAEGCCLMCKPRHLHPLLHARTEGEPPPLPAGAPVAWPWVPTSRRCQHALGGGHHHARVPFQAGPAYGM
jgi:hypothetical protein